MSILAQPLVETYYRPSYTTPEMFQYWWSDFKQNFYPCNADAWLNNRLVVEHFKNYINEQGILYTDHGSFIVELYHLESQSKKLQSIFNKWWVSSTCVVFRSQSFTLRCEPLQSSGQNFNKISKIDLWRVK